MANLIRIERALAKLAPSSSIVGADGKDPQPEVAIGYFRRTRAEAKSDLNELADAFGRRFLSGTLEPPKYVTQEQWDVIDMSQQQDLKNRKAAAEAESN